MEVTSLYNFCSEDNGGVGWSRVKGGGRRNATTPMASRSGKDYATCICFSGFLGPLGCSEKKFKCLGGFLGAFRSEFRREFIKMLFC